MWSEELASNVAYNPVAALESAQESRDVVRGLVPSGGITWLYGPSMSFKSFAAMSAAAAVSLGVPWLGRRTQESVVVYVGAEGGDALHIRRAAAEMAISEQRAGFVVVAQERPAMDRTSGLWALRGVLGGVCQSAWDRSSALDNAIRDELERDADYSEASDRCSAARYALHKLKKEAVSSRDADMNRRLEYAEAEYKKAQRARDLAEDVAKARNKYISIAEDMTERYMAEACEPEHQNILCIIDTYSQTADDDNRASVSAYIKNLRTLIEEMRAEGFTLSFLVIDHVTKEGSTYLGSVAKINDVDSQLELSRIRKTMLATLSQTKSKNCAEGADLNLELSQFVIDGYRDAEGEPLTTLVVRDGTAAAAALALNPDGNAAMLADILEKSEGIMPESELRATFREAKLAAGVKGPSADKAYRRALQALRDGDRIREIEGENGCEVSLA